MEIHEAANLFPLDEENLQALADDISENGQQVPIELLDGKVIDGRRRLRACELAGVKPMTRVIQTSDPVAYVLSLNLHRRHLTPSQLAMVAGRARDIYDRQAKERMSDGGKRGGESKGCANLRTPCDAQRASADAGKTVGVSGRSVDFATRVLENGTPELIAAVDSGRMAVSTAAVVAADPPEAQREAVARQANRTYHSVSKRREKQDEDEIEEGKSRGVGVRWANEAINCLAKIPKDDGLRNRGFQIVSDWIRRNK